MELVGEVMRFFRVLMVFLFLEIAEMGGMDRMD